MSQLRIALYQPDIPGNTGTILRLAACLGLGVDIIQPSGHAASAHYEDQFEAWRATTGRRLVLASTKAADPYTDFAFQGDDILLLGRESAGVPDAVHERADGRILIPMVEGQRSINVAMSAAMIAGEALRQTVWNRTGLA